MYCILCQENNLLFVVSLFNFVHSNKNGKNEGKMYQNSIVLHQILMNNVLVLIHLSENIVFECLILNIFPVYHQ